MGLRRSSRATLPSHSSSTLRSASPCAWCKKLKEYDMIISKFNLESFSLSLSLSPSFFPSLSLRLSFFYISHPLSLCLSPPPSLPLLFLSLTARHYWPISKKRGGGGFEHSPPKNPEWLTRDHIDIILCGSKKPTKLHGTTWI